MFLPIAAVLNASTSNNNCVLFQVSLASMLLSGVNPQDIAFGIDAAVAKGISLFSVLVSLTSPLRNGESLSIGVNPLHRAASRSLNPRDFTPAAPLSHCAKPGLGDSLMDGSGQIHSSNELMNKCIWFSVCRCRHCGTDRCYMRCCMNMHVARVHARD